jgi:hypothetical protein
VSVIFIIVPPEGVGALGELREVVGIGIGGFQRCWQGDALREHHVHAAAGIDLHHREELLGEADVVLGEAVDAPCPPRRKPALNSLPGSTVLVVPSGEVESVVALCWKA